jgi:hypothetical protein
MAVLVATMEALLTPLWSVEQYRHSYCNVETHPHEHVVQVEICSLRFISQLLHTYCLLSLAFPLDSSMLSLVMELLMVDIYGDSSQLRILGCLRIWTDVVLITSAIRDTRVAWTLIQRMTSIS